MRILHVCYTDGRSGAGIAAMRIIKAQRNCGLDAKMFVVLKYTDYPYVYKVSKIKEFYIKFCNEVSSIIIKKLNKSTNPIVHSINLFGGGGHKYINKTDCDVVHLHWVNSEMLSICQIAKIKKPVVWTLHDSWAFCGAEHYQNGMEDEAYIKNYMPNPYRGFNINRWVLKRKKCCWKNNQFYIVTPSQWETGCAQKSDLFRNNKSTTIPNCLDTNVFRPIDKLTAREILHLEKDKKYILFGAFGGISNTIKGGDLLIESLKIFAKKYDKTNVELLIFGASRQAGFPDLDFPVHFLGKISDETTMSLIYNSANVMLVPSRMDNLPQTATEPASCGVPIVCFNTGGLTDIVEHKKTGYIVNLFDVAGFAKGINWVLNEADTVLLSKQTREKALLNYNEKKCADAYFRIYKSILQ
jgi:Glycosyltransferase